VPLHCKKELHTQRFLVVPTGKSPEESNLASVEAMPWVLSYLCPSVMIGVIENITHSIAEMCQNSMYV
jgi:hypothetical protein